MDFDPEKYIASNGPQTKFDPSAYVGADAGPSELGSAGRGLAQGASFGLRDELAGALQSPVGGLKEIANKFGAGYSDEDVAKYKAERDASRALDAEAKAANPKSYLGGELGGAVATSFIPGLGVAEGAGLAGTVGHAAAQGAAYGAGNSQGESIGDLAKDTLVGAGTGAIGGAAGYGLAKAASAAARGIGSLAGKAAPGLEDTAENLAVNATGATGAQSAKFSDDAGRELLDRKLVRFGDNAKKIAQRVGEAHDEAGESIGQALSDLEAQGVKANPENVIKTLNKKIADLASDPSQAGAVSKLRKIVENIEERIPQTEGGIDPQISGVQGGNPEIPISKAESIKRGYGQGIKNWQDPEAGAASKQAYLGYRDEVERAAIDANPELAQKFMDDKKTFGLLEPIQEAAEKRANTLRQAPIGGLGDMAAAGTATLVGGGHWAIPGVIAKKVIAPRVASSLAVTTDMLAKAATSAPQVLGKFAPVIASAVQRGTQAVAATHFILQQSSPEYREKIKALQEQNGDDSAVNQ